MPISSLADLEAYYPDQLILQYRGKTRWTQMIQSIVQEAWLDGVIQEEAVCFDLDTAVGAQLDILGRIVGVSRNIYGLDLAHVFFEGTDYAGGISGVNMQQYGDATPGPEIMLTYRTDAIYSMTEFEMRTIIKLKIIYNNCPRTTKALVDAMQSMPEFPVFFIDNADMTVTYLVDKGLQTVFTIADFLGIIPKPMGVFHTIQYINAVVDDSGNTITDDDGNIIRG
jgi:hypothetical protein